MTVWRGAPSCTVPVLCPGKAASRPWTTQSLSSHIGSARLRSALWLPVPRPSAQPSAARRLPEGALSPSALPCCATAHESAALPTCPLLRVRLTPRLLRTCPTPAARPRDALVCLGAALSGRADSLSFPFGDAPPAASASPARRRFPCQQKNGPTPSGAGPLSAEP